MPLSPAEKLMHTTVRLECTNREGRVRTGTGFFFSYRIDENNTIPVIVSNKHVIKNADTGSFVLTKRDANNEPVLGSYETVRLGNFESLWIQHPDRNVDLAVFPLAPLLREAESKQIALFLLPLDETLIPDQKVLNDLSGLENITMIGYPNGIWDQKNNMPIIRRGVTATSPKYDYNDLPIFVIDCSCFPGSSGSPVLIFDQGGYMDARGNFNLGGSRVMLLGILFAGPQHVAPGEVQTIEVPLQQVPISLSRIPNNLGFVVKAQKLNDFRRLLERNVG